MDVERRVAKEQDTEQYFRHEIFEMMVNRASEIIILFSVDDNEVNYVSPNITRLLGLTPQELKEDCARLAATAVETDLLFTEDELFRLASGESDGQTRARIHQRTGETRWFQESALRGRFKDSKKFLILLSDRTNEVIAREQLEQALSIARSANEGKSTFLANMSHDIRTPMNAIIGYTHLLDQEWEYPEKVREYSRKLSASSQHLLSLINDLLDMSRLETGKTIINVSEFNFSEFLEDIRVILRPQLKAKNLQFKMQSKGIRNELLIGDKARLSQILLNILNNSVKYTPEGGQISFTITQLEQTSRRFSHLRFEIADTGIGMSPEFLEHLYEPFAREKNTTHSGVAGTGLGLAIVKNLVDLMGGTIHVSSEPNFGTTFTVELELQLTTEEVDEGFWDDHGIFRILAVDDDEYTTRDIRIAMVNTAVEVRSAASGEAAIEMVKTERQNGKSYDLILLDWKLPVMDGIETARQLRKEVGEQVPILLLTARDWVDIEDKARAAGINGFLAKPFFITNLQQTIEGLNIVPEAAADTDGVSSVLSGLHILAAEDNELNAEILSELLMIEGAECDIGENGKIVVDMFNASEPGQYDVILLDVQMPVMDGHQAARAIRASDHPDAKTIPISAMTANAFAEDVEAALESGMNAHIAKPIDLEVLKAEVFRIMNERPKE